MIKVSYGNFQFLNASGYTVPFVSISTDYQRNGAGQTIGGTNSINLEGKIIVPKDTNNNGISYLLSRESGIRQAFSIDGYDLDINGVLYKNIKVNRYNTEKTENNWTNYINYSIELISEIDSTGNGSGCFLVSSTQDEWSIDFDGEASFAPPVAVSSLGFSGNSPSTGIIFPLYRISRTLSAVGKYQPNKPQPNTNPVSSNSMPTGTSALENAEKWVKDHISKFAVNSIISGLSLYNFVRSINKSDSEGSYRLTDTWIASNTGLAKFTETFTVDSSLDERMIRTVNINGTVKGLEEFDPAKTGEYYYQTKLNNGGIKPTSKSTDFRKGDDRFSNAISGYLGIKSQIYSRAKQFATTGIKYGSFSLPQNFSRVESSLNPIPASSSETFNPIEGTISYSYSYTNRPSGIISGSISENITLNDKNSVPIIASTPALFRSVGPLYQDLGTYTSSMRTISITANFPRTGIAGLTFPPAQYPIISGMIERFNPTGLIQGIPGNTQFIKSYVKSDNMDWNVKDNSITAQKTWEWTISYIGVNNG